jgi:hypothetical protein
MLFNIPDDELWSKENGQQEMQSCALSLLSGDDNFRLAAYQIPYDI